MHDCGVACGVILGATYTLLCALLLIQMCRIVLNAHKLISFQFIFVLLGFVWTLLRGTFWLIADQTNWPVWLYIAVYVLPLVCQISMFSLLILFYAKLVHRSRWKVKRGFFITCYVLANTLMIMMTIFICGYTDIQSKSIPDNSDDESSPIGTVSMTQLDFCYYLSSAIYFGLLVILAAWHVHKIRKMGLTDHSIIHGMGQHRVVIRHRISSGSPAKNEDIEKGAQLKARIDRNDVKSRNRPRNSMHMVLSTSLSFLIFMSRCVFDFLAAFGVVSGNGFHITPSGISNPLNDQEYASSNIKTIPMIAFWLLILWEILPTSLVLIYFRKIPSNRQGPGAKLYNYLRNLFCGYNEEPERNSVSPGSISSLKDAVEDEFEDDDGEHIPLIFDSDSSTGEIYAFRNNYMANSDGQVAKSNSLSIHRTGASGDNMKNQFSKSASPVIYDSDTEARWKSAQHHSGSSDVGSGSYSIPNPYLEQINRFKNFSYNSMGNANHNQVV